MNKWKWWFGIDDKLGFLVAIGVLLLLIAIILPGRPPHNKAHAQRVVCMAKMKYLDTCLKFYYTDHDSYPTPSVWCDILQPYYEDERELYCPSDKVGPCSYAMNENIPADTETLPDDFVLFFESAPGWNQIGGADDVVVDRHDKPGANIGFADGHAEFVAAEDIPKLRWTIEDKSTERK